VVSQDKVSAFFRVDFASFVLEFIRILQNGNRYTNCINIGCFRFC